MSKIIAEMCGCFKGLIIRNLMKALDDQKIIFVVTQTIYFIFEQMFEVNKLNQPKSNKLALNMHSKLLNIIESVP